MVGGGRRLQSHHLLPSSVIQVQVFSPNFSFHILLLNSFHNFLFIYQQISLTQFTIQAQTSPLIPFQFPHSNFTPFIHFLHSQFPFKIHKLYTNFASRFSPILFKFNWVRKRKKETKKGLRERGETSQSCNGKEGKACLIFLLI